MVLGHGIDKPFLLRNLILLVAGVAAMAFFATTVADKYAIGMVGFPFLGK